LILDNSKKYFFVYDYSGSDLGRFPSHMTVYEQRKYPPLGQLVEVDGKNMHVYTKGDGENTIVLLSGLGTAAPVLDFEPLSK